LGTLSHYSRDDDDDEEEEADEEGGVGRGRGNTFNLFMWWYRYLRSIMTYYEFHR